MAHAARQHVDGRPPLNHAVQVKGTSYTLTTGAWPRGTYQWCMAAANASGSLIAAWTAPRTVILVAPAFPSPTPTETAQPTSGPGPATGTPTSTPVPPSATATPVRPSATWT